MPWGTDAEQSSPLIPTALSIGCAKTRVVPDETFDIYGWLTRTDTGAGVGGKRLSIYKKEPGQTAFSFYYEVGNYLNGFYVFSYLRFRNVGKYEFYTRFEGDAEYAACQSSVLSIEVYTPVGIATALSIKSDKTSTKVKGTVVISDGLTRTDTGARLPYKEVRLYWKKPGATEFTWQGRTSTDANGLYAIAVYLEFVGEYSFYSEFLGDEQFQGCKSDTITVESVGVATALSIAFYIKPVYVGDTAGIEGTLTAEGKGLANMVVKFYRRKDKGAWGLVKSTYTLSDGSLIFSDTLTEAGAYDWKAVFETTDVYSGSTSNIISATITEKPVALATLRLTVKEAKSPFPVVAGVTCNLNGMVRTTDSSGVAEWVDINSGWYTLSLSKDGYEPYSTSAYLSAGMNERIEYIVPTVVPPPAEWTDRLELKFYRLPWADKAAVEGAITATLVPVINAFEWIVGYDYLGYVLDWDGMILNLYYKKRATPVITAAALSSLLIAIAAILIAIGVIILAVAWYEREKRIAEESVGKKELLDAGKITSDQYTELVKAQKEAPAPWEKVVYGAIVVVAVIAAIYVLSELTKKKKESV